MLGWSNVGAFSARRTSWNITQRVRTLGFLSALLAVGLYCGLTCGAQSTTVEARVAYLVASKKDAPPDASNVVVSLTPLSPSLIRQAAAALSALPHHFELVQYHKTFEPHLLVVPQGSLVAFPNRDPFFHNVFSLFDGKPFNVGLYEAGATRSVRFDRAGVSFIFCNIHPQMGAVIITTKTPYFGVSDKAGRVRIANVPAGRYRLEVWSERALPATLKSLTRDVDIPSGPAALGVVRIKASGDLLAGHKNMYGRDYDSVVSPGLPYGQQE